MSKHSKNILNNWKLWVAVLAIVGLIFIAIIAVCENQTENASNMGKIEENKKQFTDQEIIEFAKSEIKKKLRYPETVIFQNEQILETENNKTVVSIYSVSDDKNHEEGRMKFVLGIEDNKGKLQMFNIATNEDTSTTDVCKEFEELVNKGKYEEVYNNLFSSTLKKRLTVEEFGNYNLNLEGHIATATPKVNSNGYLEYVTTTIKDKNGQYWIIIFKNGMIYSFSKVEI